MTVKQPAKSKRKNGPGRPFKPGQSGNPNGRPRKEFTIPHLLRVSSELPVSDNDKRTRMQAVIDMAWKQAQRGNKDARQWLSDRMEGRPTQAIELTEYEPDSISVINADEE